MASKPDPHRITFTEVDEVNHPTATYIYSTDGQNGRVDIVLPPHTSPTWSIRALKTLLIEVFLPAGYPHSVTDDYTAQDSLQAFSSSIAGLLSSRAVLQGVGVGNPDASPTSALLLHILQDTSGRLATILFAHRVGTALQPECKTYRLAADVFNDLAMLLDCCSPALPAGAPRVTVLSAAGVLRALCGMTCLNRQRANIVFATLLDADPALASLAPRVSAPVDAGVLTPAQVSKREAIFERDGVLRWSSAAGTGTGSVAPVLGVCRIGVSVGEFLRCLAGNQRGDRRGVPLDRVQGLFHSEAHLMFLGWGGTAWNAAILLKQGCSTPRAQLKAWMHALLAARVLGEKHEGQDETERIINVVETTLQFLNDTRVDGYLGALTQAGWDVDLAALETSPGRRIICE
ncbi:vitamin B6 photo-protection and homoeostasis-domain-containing protein [Aspergillus floccosus]